MTPYEAESMSTGLAMANERYRPSGVSSPGWPVLIGQAPSILPFHQTFVSWVAALATPGAPCTPERWAVSLPLVCACQYFRGRNHTVSLLIQYHAPVTGLLA